MRVRVAQRNQIGGWGFSLLLHGLLLSAAWPVFHHLPTPVHQEPFRWEVTLIESPQPAVAIETASDSPSTNQLLQTGETGERTQPSPTRDLPSTVPQQTNDIAETIQPPDEVGPVTTLPAPTVFAPAQPEAVSPMPSMTEPTPAVQATLPAQREAPERPQSMVAATPVATEPPTPTASPVEQEAPATPMPSVADVAMATTPSREPSLTPPVSAPPTASNQPSAPRADYGWLQRAVSRRLEELKRFSRPSLGESTKLKVLVKAVVSNSGELMETQVVKSSGLARIDQDAVALVQRAFPVSLEEVIDRPQIVMRIPITYSRD